MAQNTGWVGVGVDHDTASFAVETIRRWWYAMGSERYPKAQKLLITADGGGSNGPGTSCGLSNDNALHREKLRRPPPEQSCGSAELAEAIATQWNVVRGGGRGMRQGYDYSAIDPVPTLRPGAELQYS